MPEVFDRLDRLVKEGKLRHYGVSVEKVEEAIKALDFPGVQSVQIIFNLFRQRAAEVFLPLAAQQKGRHPGALAAVVRHAQRQADTDEHTFAEDDHRHFNRDGAGFDKGRTFSGLPMTPASPPSSASALVPAGMSMAQLALRWILMNPAVTCTIPGGKRPTRWPTTSLRLTCPSSHRP